MPLQTPPPEQASASSGASTSTATSETIQSVHSDERPSARAADSAAAVVPAIEDEDDIITISIADDVQSAGGSKILSLVPPPPPSSDTAGSSSDSNRSSKPAFQLRTSISTNLPQALLDRFQLSSRRPAHFSRGTSVHVLVSTLSGTGLAGAFFADVLTPCLQALGLGDDGGDGYAVVRTQSAATVREYARDVLSGGAARGERQTVVLLSGDGGVVDVVNGLAESQAGRGPISSSSYRRPSIVLLPFGTGNALFHSLHAQSTVPSIYVQSLRTLLNGHPRPLPLFRATFSPGARILTDESRTATPLPEYSLIHTSSHTQGNDRENDDDAAPDAPVRALYGAVVASYGLHSTLVADSDTPEYRKHGDKRFGLVAKDLLFPEGGALPHAYQADVTLRRKTAKEETDGESESKSKSESESKNPSREEERDEKGEEAGEEAGEQEEVSESKIPRPTHGYLLLTLVSHLERTFNISPRSTPLDGQLRIVHFPPVSGERAMAIMTRAYDGGKHVFEDGVGYESVQGVRVEFREGGADWRWRRCCVDGVVVGVEEGGWMDVEVVGRGGELVDVVVD